MVVPFSQAWPFDPTAGTLPCGYRAGFFGQWPLAQDPIAWAMAVQCDMDCEQLHGPSPIFGDTLGRQLDALACDYVFTYPAQHPERIEWVESTRVVDTIAGTWPGFGLFQRSTFEVARLQTPGGGLLRIENIDTYLRVTIPAQGGVQTFLVSGIRSDLLDQGPMGGFSITDPFPFPFDIGGFGPITVRWHLVHQWVDEAAGKQPPWATNARERAVIPATFQPRVPWNDNRYGWGGLYGRKKQFSFGGAGIVRLFVTLEVSAVINQSNTRVRVSGSLQGFRQIAGRDAAAVRNTTLRTS